MATSYTQGTAGQINPSQGMNIDLTNASPQVKQQFSALASQLMNAHPGFDNSYLQDVVYGYRNGQPYNKWGQILQTDNKGQPILKTTFNIPANTVNLLQGQGKDARYSQVVNLVNQAKQLADTSGVAYQIGNYSVAERPTAESQQLASGNLSGKLTTGAKPQFSASLPSSTVQSKSMTINPTTAAQAKTQAGQAALKAQGYTDYQILQYMNGGALPAPSASPTIASKTTVNTPGAVKASDGSYYVPGSGGGVSRTGTTQTASPASQAISAIADVVDKHLQDSGKGTLAPTQLTDQELAGITAQIEQRYGPYFTTILNQAKKIYDENASQLTAAQQYLNEDLGTQTDYEKAQADQGLSQQDLLAQRAQEDTSTALQREARNLEESKADTLDALQARGLATSGMASRSLSQLTSKYNDTTSDLGKSLNRANADVLTSKRSIMSGLEYKLGSSNINKPSWYSSPYSTQQPGSVYTNYNRGIQSNASSRRSLDTGWATTQADIANQKLKDEETAKNAEINRRLLSYT